MTVIKAVIFDLDGVIIDSNPAIESFWKSWTDKTSIDLTPAMVREWIHGRKVYDTIDGIFGHLSQEEKQAIIDDAYHFDEHMQPGAIAGVVEFLQALRTAGIPTGVVTSSHQPRMLKMLEGIGVQDHFTQFVTAHDVQFGKPHPEPYEKMCEKMQLESHHCLVFEDAVSGIRSATAAGMHTIGIGDHDAKESLCSHGACDVIENFSLIEVIGQHFHVNGRNCFQIGNCDTWPQ